MEGVGGASRGSPRACAARSRRRTTPGMATVGTAVATSPGVLNFARLCAAGAAWGGVVADAAVAAAAVVVSDSGCALGFILPVALLRHHTHTHTHTTPVLLHGPRWATSCHLSPTRHRKVGLAGRRAVGDGRTSLPRGLRNDASMSSTNKSSCTMDSTSRECAYTCCGGSTRYLRYRTCVRLSKPRDTNGP